MSAQVRRILLCALLLGTAQAQPAAGSASPPAQITATPTPAAEGPETSDRDGQADALRTGVPDVSGAPVPLTVEQERAAQRLGTKIHCPICPGESIAQSQTDISRQMMDEVRAGIRAGKSERAILSAFVASYGERILLEPPRRGLNWLLWTGPLAALAIGGALWTTYLRRASRPPAQELSAEDERRIAELLRERREVPGDA